MPSIFFSALKSRHSNQVQSGWVEPDVDPRARGGLRGEEGDQDEGLAVKKVVGKGWVLAVRDELPAHWTGFSIKPLIMRSKK